MTGTLDRIQALEAHYEPFVTIVAALAIYGEGANLAALVEKARELNDAETVRRSVDRYTARRALARLEEP